MIWYNQDQWDVVHWAITVISIRVVTAFETIGIRVQIQSNNDTEEVSEISNESPCSENGHSVLDDSGKVVWLAIKLEVVLFVYDSGLIFMVVIHLWFYTNDFYLT